MVAIVRKVYNRSSVPRLGVLAPEVKVFSAMLWWFPQGCGVAEMYRSGSSISPKSLNSDAEAQNEVKFICVLFIPTFF
jgi:hypothetical protein